MRPRFEHAARGIFSFPAVLAAGLAVLCVLTARGRLADPDLWWHLKMGEVIWKNRAIPRTDLFSYTTNHHAIVPHEWLAQVTIYAAWALGGYTGLMVWLCVATSLLVIAAYALAAVYSGNAKVALLGGLVTWFFATTGFSIRPQLLGYLLLVCELLIIEIARHYRPGWYLLLPPLFALWVNLHGSFFLGLMVLAVVLGCSFLDFHAGLLAASRRPARERWWLASALGFSVAALFLNPAGLQQVLYPLDVMLKQPVQKIMIAEWRHLDFSDPRALAAVAAAAAVLLLPLALRGSLGIEELLLVALGLCLAMKHERLLFVSGILAAPVLCRLLADSWDRYDPLRDCPRANAVALALAAIVIAWGFPGCAGLAREAAEANPVKAVEYLRQSGLTGRMLNDYRFGGYLIWTAPEHPVFVDERAEIFEWTGVLRDYLRWTSVDEDPNLLLDKYRIAFCLLARDTAIARVMRLLPGWKQVYSDNRAVIFVRNAIPSRIAANGIARKDDWKLDR